jgi:hypothetical protein
VNPGDVIAYEYDIDARDYAFALFHSFNFQREIPTLYSHVVVEIPRGWKLISAGVMMDSAVTVCDGNRYEWKFENLPFREEEPYMPSWNRLVRRVHFGVYDPDGKSAFKRLDWPEVAAWAREKFDTVCVPSPNIEDLVSTFTAKYTEELELIRALCEYVRDEIRYVAVEIGEGRFDPRMASTTLLNKFGDCKDKTTLLRTMLKAAGYQSSAVLAAVGDTVFSDLPSPFQFNHAIIAISFEGVDLPDGYNDANVDGWLYFDPTAAQISFSDLPRELYGTRVLRISLPDPELIELPTQQSGHYRTKFTADARLNEDNSIEADVMVSYFGIRAAQKKYWIKSVTIEKQIKNYLAVFSDNIGNLKISDYTSDYNDDSSWVRFNLTGEGYSTRTGDLTTMKLDFSSPHIPLEKIKKDRVHPISFGRPRRYESEIKWRLPDGWRFEKSPDTNVYKCSIAELSFAAEADGGTMIINSTVDYQGGWLSAEQYKMGARFIKNLKRTNNILAVILK